MDISIKSEHLATVLLLYTSNIKRQPYYYDTIGSHLKTAGCVTPKGSLYKCFFSHSQSKFFFNCGRLQTVLAEFAEMHNKLINKRETLTEATRLT